jgi:hypothetical protein
MNEEIEKDRMTAEGAPDPTPTDEKSAFAKAADALPPAPTKDQLRSLVDVLVADVRRVVEKAKKNVKPADVQTLVRVGDRAVKFAIKVRTTRTSDAKAVAKLDADRRQIEAQLASVKSVASSVAAKTFWKITDAVIDRLAAFTVAAIVAV